MTGKSCSNPHPIKASQDIVRQREKSLSRHALVALVLAACGALIVFW